MKMKKTTFDMGTLTTGNGKHTTLTHGQTSVKRHSTIC